MAVDAVSFLPTIKVGRTGMFVGQHGLKMRGVVAGRVAAKMMEMVAVWDRSDQFAIGNFMGSVGFLEYGITHVAIAMRFCAFIVPAAEITHVMEHTKRGGSNR